MKMLWVEPSPVCRASPRITASTEGLAGGPALDQGLVVAAAGVATHVVDVVALDAGAGELSEGDPGAGERVEVLPRTTSR
jgi:hypothetical protein